MNSIESHMWRKSIRVEQFGWNVSEKKIAGTYVIAHTHTNVIRQFIGEGELGKNREKFN